MSAFANGTEWDTWSSRWCDRCVREPICPLLTAVFCDDTTPKEWALSRPGTLNPYDCTQFREQP